MNGLVAICAVGNGVVPFNTLTFQGPVPVKVSVTETESPLPAQMAPPPLNTAVGNALMLTSKLAETSGQLPDAAMVLVTL